MRNYRSKEVLDDDGNKWRHYGNSTSSVCQKKLGRSWATWLGMVPNEVKNKLNELSVDDYVACR
jgi:hypothetical protein